MQAAQKISEARRAKNRRAEAYFEYVDARRTSATKHMSLFQQPASENMSGAKIVRIATELGKHGNAGGILGETAEPFPAVELFFPMQGIESLGNARRSWCAIHVESHGIVILSN